VPPPSPDARVRPAHPPVRLPPSPGLLAAGILVLVRTFGMVELTFLTSGPSSQTLIVALFSAVNSAGIRSTQSVDAMAVLYTASMAVLLLIALRFVNSAQLVARSND
jgi:putative spermidine/putrescine transport system permease protein